MPEPPEQFKVFPAAVRAVPALAEMDMTLAAGYVSIHCRAAGSLPEGEVRTRFKDTVPFAPAVPDDSAMASGPVPGAPKDTEEAAAKINAMTPRILFFFIAALEQKY